MRENLRSILFVHITRIYAVYRVLCTIYSLTVAMILRCYAIGLGIYRTNSSKNHYDNYYYYCSFLSREEKVERINTVNTLHLKRAPIPSKKTY